MVTSETDRDNKFMKSVLRTELIKEKENNLSPKLSSSKEKREKTIRVTSQTYERLLRLGKMGDDLEDVISKVLDRYDDCVKSHSDSRGEEANDNANIREEEEEDNKEHKMKLIPQEELGKCDWCNENPVVVFPLGTSDKPSHLCKGCVDKLINEMVANKKELTLDLGQAIQEQIQQG